MKNRINARKSKKNSILSSRILVIGPYFWLENSFCVRASERALSKDSVYSQNVRFLSKNGICGIDLRIIFRCATTKCKNFLTNSSLWQLFHNKILLSLNKCMEFMFVFSWHRAQFYLHAFCIRFTLPFTLLAKINCMQCLCEYRARAYNTIQSNVMIPFSKKEEFCFNVHSNIELVTRKPNVHTAQWTLHNQCLGRRWIDACSLNRPTVCSFELYLLFNRIYLLWNAIFTFSKVLMSRVYLSRFRKLGKEPSKW